MSESFDLTHFFMITFPTSNHAKLLIMIWRNLLANIVKKHNWINLVSNYRIV
jgi:hypothetical protein